jgi:organic hydroperoxide reductase OsmC/OhrA
MPQPFPHHYTAELEVKDAVVSVLKAPSRPAILGSNPPEFDGKPDTWSPEHLLLAALQLCYRGTWLALAAKPGIQAKTFTTKASAKLEKTALGIVFTEVKLHVSATVPAEHVEATKDLLVKSKKYCIIANQMKTEATLELDVQAG